MLRPAPYDDLRKRFDWDLPETLNMARQVCDAWAEAGERGRWPSEVRPHTTNRRHIMRKIWEPGN